MSRLSEEKGKKTGNRKLDMSDLKAAVTSGVNTASENGSYFDVSPYANHVNKEVLTQGNDNNPSEIVKTSSIINSIKSNFAKRESILGDAKTAFLKSQINQTNMSYNDRMKKDNNKIGCTSNINKKDKPDCSVFVQEKNTLIGQLKNIFDGEES